MIVTGCFCLFYLKIIAVIQVSNSTSTKDLPTSNTKLLNLAKDYVEQEYLTLPKLPNLSVRKDW